MSSSREKYLDIKNAWLEETQWESTYEYRELNDASIHLLLSYYCANADNGFVRSSFRKLVELALTSEDTHTEEINSFVKFFFDALDTADEYNAGTWRTASNVVIPALANPELNPDLLARACFFSRWSFRRVASQNPACPEEGRVFVALREMYSVS